MANRMICLAGITSTALFMPTGAIAATDVVPSFTLTANAADNARLVPDTVITETSRSTVLNASLDATIYNERGFIELQPRIDINAYSDAEDDDLDGGDQFLRTRAQYEWQRVRVGFRSDYRREAIIRSELPDVADPDFDDEIDIDVPDSVDSGRLIFLEQDRKRLNLSPYIELRTAQRTRFRLQSNLTDVSYSGGDSAIRTGYDSQSLQASLIRQANERNRFTVTIDARNYEAGGTGNDTDSIRITGGFNSRLNELWILDLRAGIERDDFSYSIIPNENTVADSSNDYLFWAKARRTGERTRMEFSIDRSQNGSASGYVVNRDQLRMYVDHELKPRVAMRIGLRAESYDGGGGVASVNDRDYLRAEFGVSWAIQPRWSLIGGYDYTSQEFVEDFSDSRSSNVVYFGIRYMGRTRPGAP